MNCACVRVWWSRTMFRRIGGAGDDPKHLTHVWVRVRGVLRELVSTPVPRRCLSVRVRVLVRECVPDGRWCTHKRAHTYTHTQTHTPRARMHACAARADTHSRHATDAHALSSLRRSAASSLGRKAASASNRARSLSLSDGGLARERPTARTRGWSSGARTQNASLQCLAHPWLWMVLRACLKMPLAPAQQSTAGPSCNLTRREFLGTPGRMKGEGTRKAFPDKLDAISSFY